MSVFREHDDILTSGDAAGPAGDARGSAGGREAVSIVAQVRSPGRRGRSFTARQFLIGIAGAVLGVIGWLLVGLFMSAPPTLSGCRG